MSAGVIGLIGLRVSDDGDGTVSVALDGAHLAQGLVELRCLPTVLPGGTDTLRIDLRAADHLSSISVATLLRVKRVCVARRIHLVLERPTGRGHGRLVREGLRDVLESAVRR
ncbi:hypothetical protein V3N99_15200 [Dermatophilaceae bacterium Soc4.6]